MKGWANAELSLAQSQVRGEGGGLGASHLVCDFNSSGGVVDDQRGLRG